MFRTFYNITFKKKLYKHFRTKNWDINDPRISLDFFLCDLFQENVKELINRNDNISRILML